MRFRRQKTHDFPALREPPPVLVPPADVQSDGYRPWLQVGTPRRFALTRARLPVADLPAALAGLRIAHLTDLHLRPAWGAAYDRLIAHFAADPPDLILLTGDVIDLPCELNRVLPVAERLLRALSSRLGTYAILGNHDSLLLAPYLGGMGVHRVTGQSRMVSAGGEARVELVGMQGAERHDVIGEFFRRMPPRTAGVPRIVLSHYPDLFAPSQAMEADVYLAGHTHGGQICLPGGRPLLTHDRLPRRFCKGIHRLGRTWMVVGRGLGMTGLPLRTFCPSEVIEITLVPSGGIS